MIQSMDFKYRSFKGKHWDQESLERVLALKYPGCKTLLEALSKAKTDLTQGETVKTQPEASSLEIDTFPTRATPTITPIDERIDF